MMAVFDKIVQIRGLNEETAFFMCIGSYYYYYFFVMKVNTSLAPPLPAPLSNLLSLPYFSSFHPFVNSGHSSPATVQAFVFIAGRVQHLFSPLADSRRITHIYTRSNIQYS